MRRQTGLFNIQDQEMDMLENKNRCFVRGDFTFKVNFKLMTPEEYNALKGLEGEGVASAMLSESLNMATVKKSMLGAVDASLVNFFFQIDEKLDQILKLLSQDQANQILPYQGVGLDISGSGMKIEIDRPVETGKIMHAKILLSKFPFVFIDVFGEILWVEPVEEGAQALYYLGIKFFDLSPDHRERIISSVFQREREAIRNKRKGD